MTSPQQSFNILLVDDDLMVVRVLAHALSDFTPVRFATSGRMALKLARESIPDLVLLDVDMPDVSGFEVCAAFKSDVVLASVPIIFVTGHTSPQLEAKCFALGAVDFISKPPHAPLVLARVRTHHRLKSLSDTLSGTLRGAVTRDFLTGAITRRELEKTLTQEWLRAQRTAAPLALLLMDIDDFTAYNAERGEDAGDARLRAVADALRLAVQRPTDVIGRWAGGQFALLLPETGADGAGIVAQRAILALTDLPLSQGLTLSLGGAYRESSRAGVQGRPPASDGMPNDLILAAEHALASATPKGGPPFRLIDIAHLATPWATP